MATRCSSCDMTTPSRQHERSHVAIQPTTRKPFRFGTREAALSTLGKSGNQLSLRQCAALDALTVGKFQ